jgi:hypothetical protein
MLPTILGVVGTVILLLDILAIVSVLPGRSEVIFVRPRRMVASAWLALEWPGQTASSAVRWRPLRTPRQNTNPFLAA